MRQTIRKFIRTIMFFLWTTALVNPTPAQQEYPPGTFELTPKTHVELQPTRVEVDEQFSFLPEDLTLNLPPGFAARVFVAFDIEPKGPRFMAFDPQGVLHVAMTSLDQIVALPDRDGDGVADEAIVVAEGFQRAHSLAFYQGNMYVADRGQIVRFQDLDGNGIYEERSVLVGRIPTSGSHSTRTIVVDEINEKIYLSVGWPGDMGRVSESERGVILQFNTDGTGRRVFANGVRNVVGMDLHPITNQLWATNNGHDREGTELPPEWIDIIREDGFYGVPFAFPHQVYVDFSIPPYDKTPPLSREDSLLVQSMERPAALVPAHLAPMGIHFYTHDQFPSKYWNAAFIALHAGHAKLAPIPGYSVIALFNEPDGSNARIEDFLTGFQTGTEMADVWGTPMGIISDEEGNLYVSIDKGRKLILRIEHSPIIASWSHNLPDSVRSGTLLNVEATVQTIRLAKEADSPTLTADLSALRGPERIPLEALEDETYHLSATVPADVPEGFHTISVTVRQEAEPEPHQIRLAKTIAVVPDLRSRVLTIFDESLGAGWSVDNKTWLKDLPEDLAQTDVVFAGHHAAAFPVQEGDWDWVVRFRAVPPLNHLGYDNLHFAFHPSNAELPKTLSFSVYTAGTLVDLLKEQRVDLTRHSWQMVEIPLKVFTPRQEIEEVTFSGNFGGTFFLDDLKLVSSAPPTAVVGEKEIPAFFALAQNYPNPFNSGTMIEFVVPEHDHVRLIVYNLGGQEVMRLVDGRRPTGTYKIYWSGVDATGHRVASGVYLYRLEIGKQGLSHKLMLLE